MVITYQFWSILALIMSFLVVKSIQACNTEVVYPLMYGTGTWDLFINDIAVFGSADVLVGGKSFSTKAAGEGFIMRIDKYGKILWQNLYKSTATGEDSVDKVGVSNDFSFATGHSTSGSSNTYFLLKFSTDGTNLYNAQIASDTNKIGSNSVIFNFALLSDSTAQVYYDGTLNSAHRTIASFYTMDGSSSETMFGLNGIANSAFIKTTPLSATAQTVYSIYNGALMLVYYDTANPLASGAKYVTNGLTTLSYLPGKSDMDMKSDNSEGWIAVISTDSYIYGFHSTVGTLTTLSMARAFRINGFSSTPNYVSMMYVDSTHCIVATMLSDNSGVIFKVDQSTTSTPTVTGKSIPSLTNGKLMGTKLSSGFLLGASIIGGESTSFTKSQGIVYKASDDLTFASYSCYEISTSVSLTASQYSLANSSLNVFQMAAFTPNLVIDSISYSAGASSNILTSSGIEIRAQSTKTNTSGSSNCKLQPSSFAYTAESFKVTTTASNVSRLMVSQCQGAPITYSVSISGLSNFPSWIQCSTSSYTCDIKPSLITSISDLKTYTISESVSDKNSIQNTVTSTYSVTFSNSVPVAVNVLSNQIMYKGMGTNIINLPSNIFTDDDIITLSVSNNLSGNNPTIFSLSDYKISIKMPDIYTGAFAVSVTAKDYFGQTASSTFSIVVNNCTQTGCDYCIGTGLTACTKCLDCYILSSGTCVYDKTNCANYTAPTYLTREVTATSPAGVGAPVAAATVASVGASVATGSSPVVAGLGISQCQSIQALSMFNMNTPDNYVSYSQGYEVTKLNFKFVNGIGLQDSMLKGTRRNLSTGYKSLSNIGFSSGNFFVNYIYFFLVLLVMIIVHLIVSLMKLCCSRKDPKSKCKRCINWMKRGFEFSWYLNLFIFASLFIFILSINDMAGRDTSTGLNIFSFILSIIFFILMIVLMLFPLLLLCKQQTKLLEISQDKDNLKGFFSKLTYNYMKGLKLTRGARLYNFVFILRRLILAILIVCADNKTTQLVIFILLNVGFTLYMIVIRPFVYKTQNFIGIFNEIILLVCCFLMFAFFDTGSVKTGVGILMIVLFSINIIICFSVSFLFEIYLYCRRRKFNSIEVVKGGEIVKYHTQKPVDEPSYIKDESESRTNKNVLPLINPSIIQPDIPNEDFKINDESRDLGI